MLKKKISKILIGTNNKGKLREIKGLLPKSIKIFSTSDFNLKSPAENGKTFKENSIIKSKYFSKKSNLVLIVWIRSLESFQRDGQDPRGILTKQLKEYIKS